MRLSTYVPALGQQEVLDECVELLASNSTLPDTKLFVIDNGSKTPIHSEYAFVIRNEENRGMVGTLRQAREHTDAEVLVYQHSDLYLYEEGWDARIVEAFESDPKLGMLGVVGAEWATKDGGRARVWCSFRDWQNHGSQPRRPITPVALLDGCWCAMRVSMMDELGIPDTSYPTHHFYDKDASLTATMASWRVGVIDLDCEHLSGKTSCQPEYQEWAKKKHGGDEEIYLQAERRYLEKWGKCFTVKVGKDWRVDVSQP